MSFGIIVKKYEHYNRALGKYIKSKKHYQEEMRKGGFVSSEEGHRLAEKYQKEKKWKPSGDCIDVIKTLKGGADKNGKVVLAHYPKVVDVMKKKGMSFDTKKLPKHYQDQWGE